LIIPVDFEPQWMIHFTSCLGEWSGGFAGQNEGIYSPDGQVAEPVLPKLNANL